MKDRRINIRISADLFHRLDEKRWREKTSFNKVGTALFRGWLQNRFDISKKQPKIDPTAPKGGPENHPELPEWAGVLDAILKSDNELAVTAVKHNLMAFREFVLVAQRNISGDKNANPIPRFTYAPEDFRRDTADVDKLEQLTDALVDEANNIVGHGNETTEPVSTAKRAAKKKPKRPKT